MKTKKELEQRLHELDIAISEHETILEHKIKRVGILRRLGRIEEAEISENFTRRYY